MSLEKIQKQLDSDTLEEMNALSVEQLKEKIVAAEQSIREAQEALNENPNYQKLKEDIKSVRSGFSEVKKRQRAIAEYALIRLEEKGQS